MVCVLVGCTVTGLKGVGLCSGVSKLDSTLLKVDLLVGSSNLDVELLIGVNDVSKCGVTLEEVVRFEIAGHLSGSFSCKGK